MEYSVEHEVNIYRVNAYLNLFRLQERIPQSSLLDNVTDKGEIDIVRIGKSYFPFLDGFTVPMMYQKFSIEVEKLLGPLDESKFL